MIRYKLACNANFAGWIDQPCMTPTDETLKTCGCSRCSYLRRVRHQTTLPDLPKHQRTSVRLATRRYKKGSKFKQSFMDKKASSE